MPIFIMYIYMYPLPFAGQCNTEGEGPSTVPRVEAGAIPKKRHNRIKKMREHKRWRESLYEKRGR